MVASLLAFCASPRIAPGSARAATRARWEASGATLPTAYPSYGNGENQPNVDSTGGALLSSAAGSRMKPLCVNEAKGRPVKWQCGSVKMKADCGGELQDEAALCWLLVSSVQKIPDFRRNDFSLRSNFSLIGDAG